MKRIVIVGATSALAQHCARLWAERGPADLTLIGRNETRLQVLAADLAVRSPSSNIHVLTTNFVDPAAIRETVDQVASKGPIDTVLIAHGSLPDQVACQNKLPDTHEALYLNGISPALFAEALVGHMACTGGGTLGLIGSVAGDRGRKSNYVYGAAKGMVTRYAQGLQHRFADSNVQVVLIKPGPTDTPMTAHLKAKGANLAHPQAVAHRIIQGMARGWPVVHAPAKWWLIMMVIRHLPRTIFNKMDI